jgi:hypothetical protein
MLSRAALFVLALALLLLVIGGGLIASGVIGPLMRQSELQAMNWQSLPAQPCRVTSVTPGNPPDYLLGDYIRIGCAGASGAEDVATYAIPANMVQIAALAPLRGQTVNLQLVDDRYGPIGPGKTLARWIVAMAVDGRPVLSGARLNPYYVDYLRPTLGKTVLTGLLGIAALLAGAAILYRGFRRPRDGAA